MLIDRYFNSTELSYVCTDNYQGGFEATKYLLNNGHEKILCIQGTPHSMPVRERVRGYLDALRGHGIEQNARIAGNSFSIQNGYLETKLALNSPERPTAIFALSNTILLGAIKAIKESGLSIPDDISAITFDNNTFLDFIDPPITRISQPVNEIGTLAVKLLMQGIAEKRSTGARMQLQPQLIVCDSVANILDYQYDEIQTYDLSVSFEAGEETQAALSQARAFWKELKAGEHTVNYWQQDSTGKWNKKA